MQFHQYNLQPTAEKGKDVLKFWKSQKKRLQNYPFFSNVTDQKSRISDVTHLYPMHSFSTPWKHQKAVRFARERVYLEQKG